MPISIEMCCFLELAYQCGFGNGAEVHQGRKMKGVICEILVSVVKTSILKGAAILTDR